jgi:ubiquinone/menaquinone biosynthesis C-methylase UbiE
MITGFWSSAAIYAAAKMGIADHLACGPQASNELATRLGVNPGALYRLLRALASIGLFTEAEPGYFALTPLGEFLRSDVPGSLRAFSIAGKELGWESWGELSYSVKTGETAFERLHGMAYFEYLRHNAELARLFDAAMSGFAAANGLAVIEAYDFSPFAVIIDVGGGHGTLISAILKQNFNARGVVYDLPDVLEGARKSLGAMGLADRCEFIGGDFFESVPSGGDAYLLTSVIHDWDDEPSLTILNNCRRIMGSESRLLLVEMIIPPGDTPSLGKFLDLNMLVNFGGRERTEMEYRQLLATAGFRVTKIVPTSTPSSLIEAIPG